MHLREAIKQCLQNRALKSTDLALKVVSLMHPVTFSTDTFHDTLERMVAEGEIQEVEYEILHTQRLKSIYFAKNAIITKVIMNGVQEL